MPTRLIVGDCREKLREMPDASVHCVVTSPPYWGLRDYGTGQWEGGDPACDHISHEIRTGLGMAALGEQYRGGGKKASEPKPIQFRDQCGTCGAKRIDRQIGMEPTLAEHIAVMVEVFREVRRVMRDAATLWLNYGDCYSAQPGQRKTTDKVGAKQESNAGSVSTGSRCEPTLKPKDLCMAANRLAIALQDDGWWVRSEIIWHKPNPMPESVTDRPTSSHEKLWLLAKSARYYYDAEAVRAPGSEPRDFQEETRSDGSLALLNGRASRQALGSTGFGTTGTRNLRNVWTIATAPFPEAHFATFPPALVEPCIKAGCPVGGTVLDPFAGSGTVGLVADRLGRNAILVELNADYTDMARERISADAPLFAEIGD